MRKIRNSLKAFFSKPANIILSIFAVVLVALTLYPLFELIRQTFVVHATDLTIFPDLKKGAYTDRSWIKILFTESNRYSLINFYNPMKNSLILSVLSALLALIFGGAVAWFVTRSNIKAKKFISTIFVFPYILPSWTLALFWLNMFKNPFVGTGSEGFVYAFTGFSAP